MSIRRTRGVIFYSGSELTTMSLHIGHSACGSLTPRYCVSVQNHALLMRRQRSALLLRISFLGQQLSATSSMRAAHQVNTIRCRSSTSEMRQTSPVMSRRVRPPLGAMVSSLLPGAFKRCLGPVLERCSAMKMSCASQRTAASPPSETAVRQPPAVRERTLSRSQVVDKQVCSSPPAQQQ